jgi:hypothetical protein
MAMDLSTKTDQELNNLIDNHRRKKLLRAPLYLEVLTERGRRRENGLEFVKSVRIILEAAREGQCVSYKQLADASGATWSKVHYAINQHLWDLVSWANGNGWPMLSAVVVNHKNIENRRMDPETLKGFIAAAEELGRSDIGADHDAFLAAEQTRVFEFAREHPEL